MTEKNELKAKLFEYVSEYKNNKNLNNKFEIRNKILTISNQLEKINTNKHTNESILDYYIIL